MLPKVGFLKVPEPKTAKNRLHLDLQVSGGRHLDADKRTARIEEFAAAPRRRRRDRRLPLDAGRPPRPHHHGRSGGQRVLRGVRPWAHGVWSQTPSIRVLWLAFLTNGGKSTPFQAVVHSRRSAWIGPPRARADQRDGTTRARPRALPISVVPAGEPRPDGPQGLGRSGRRAPPRPGCVATRTPSRRGLHPCDGRRAVRLVAAKLPAEVPVFATTTADTRPRRAGLICSRLGRVAEGLTRQGLPVDAPGAVLLRAAWDLAILDLVLMIDSALRLGDVTLAELEEFAHSGLPGSRRLRAALALADARSESPWETILRIFHRVADVPVEPQVTIVDPEGGFVARADLVVLSTGGLHRYDGAVHGSPRQRVRDLRRSRRLSEIGRCVTASRSADLVPPRRHDAGARPGSRASS